MSPESSDAIRILHVDDDPDFAEVTATFLEREDARFDVAVADSASAGKEHIEQRRVDCIVSDYEMPGENGIEFLESVRETHPDVPFILFTGKGSEEVASDAISAGVTDYLQKEGGTDQYTVLANRITNAVEHRQAQQRVERSEQRLREIIDSLPHFLYVVDRDGTYLLANEALAEFHDMTVEELEGSQITEVLDSRTADQLREDVADVLGADAAKRIPEVEVSDPEGETHIFEPQLQPYEFGDADTPAVLGIAADVTDRKEREQQLEETRERMRLALEHTNSVIFELDCDTGEVVRHGTYSEFFDLSPDAVPTWEDHLEHVVHPDDRERFRQFYQELIDGDSDGGQLEYRIAPETGDRRWIRDTVSLEETADSEPRQAVGIAREITEDKERERTLRRKERRYQAVFDDPNILVGLSDTDGTVLDVNETALEYVDATLEDVTGEKFWDTPWVTDSEELRGSVRAEIERAADGTYVEFETALQRPDGEPYTVEGVFRPVTDDDGEVVSLILSARDITERTERERELRKYEAYLEGSNDIITVLDEAGVVRYQSPSLTRILGHEPDALVGENGFDLVHPDDVDQLSATFAELVDNPDRSVTAEARFQTADGEWRWLEVRGRNQLDHPVIDGIVTNNRDITERKAYEHDLEQTNALLSTLFETLPVGVLVEDASRDVLAVNERFVDLFELRVSPEELVGTNCERLLGEVGDIVSDSEAFVGRVATLIDRREPVRDEQVSLADGRTLEQRYEPIELPDGEGHLWVYSDITERKAHEERLEALNETTRELMTAETREQVAEIGAYAARDVLNMDSNAVHLYDDEESALVPTAVTDAGRELVGNPPTLTENSIAWRVYEDGEPLALDDVHEDPDIYNPDSPVRSELHLPLGEYGILIACSEKAADFDQQDVVMGEILASNVAAALEQVEQTEQLRGRERELTRQNQRLEEFASVVSHDLRNPLRVASGRLELLREERESEHLDAVERALDRMNALIDDVLTLAREGAQVQDLEAVSLADLVEACWQNVDTRRADLETATTRTIRADRSRLQRLFENLIRNAVEHGGEDITVTVGDLDDGFYVADSGPGIPAEERESVFEAGYSTTSDGTGFGLSIVKQICDAHGWDIAITDSDAGGARFEITNVGTTA